MLPVLGALEEKRKADPVVVIGVHSAKFDAENEPHRIREAMARHGVRHPVVVDQRHRIWQAYAIRSWPTLVVIRPDGTIAAVAPGEAEEGPLDAFVGRVLDEARADGSLTGQGGAAYAVPSSTRSGVLDAPGKVIALPGDLLAVSDSGHHRVLVLDREGEVEATLGSGRPGLADGPAEEARFHGPQGLAVDGDTLFVADTGNHVIRAIDLATGDVRTVAGTGALGHGIPVGSVPARGIALRSPWDVAVAGGHLLIAMAGTHQLWALDREAGQIRVFAGSGREALVDGPFPAAAFAQPSGLALHDMDLYVADPETSAVRHLDLAHGQVRTLVGTGLFDFGDRDGARAEALLQHPLGVAVHPAGILVADSYNDKIKVVRGDAVATWFAGAGGVTLQEPGGLTVRGDGRVVVADTGHHRLVVVSADGTQAEVLAVREAPPPEAADDELAIALPPVRLAPDATRLRVRLLAPPRFSLDAVWAVRISTGASGRLSSGTGPEIEAELPPGAPKADELVIEVDAVACGPDESPACWPVGGRFAAGVLASGADAVEIPIAAPCA